MTRTLAHVTLLIFVLSMSIGAFAATKSQTVTLFQEASLNGKTLPAGDYTLKCNTTGSTAQVRFLKNGKGVASANGQVKQLAKAPEWAEIVTQQRNGGSTISEIDFSHSNTAVTFGSGTNMARAGQ